MANFREVDIREHATVPRNPLGRAREARKSLARLVAVGDLFVLTLAVLVAYEVRSRIGQVGDLPAMSAEGWVLLSLPLVWLFFLQRFGCYRPEYLNATSDAFRRYVGGVATGLVAVGFMSFVLNLDLSRGFVGLIAISALLLGGLSRLLTRRYIINRVQAGDLRQGLLIVGLDREAVQVAEAMARSPRSGYEVTGFLVDPSAGGETPKTDLPVFGTVGDLDAVLSEQPVGVVLVTPTAVTAGTLEHLMERLEGSGVGLAVAPSLFQVVTRRVAVESVANVPILHVDRIELDRFKAFLKRSLDIAAAFGVGLLTLPIWLPTILLIKLEDGGPVLFRQTRMGRDGRRFTMLKFRSMVVDAEERLDDLEHLNEVGDGFFKMKDDPRITRIGRHIRKWSIDELPQLWNILRGEMSMVGPRPPLPSEVAEYAPWQLRRLRTRPGLTGVWQTSGRSEVPFDEAVRMDLFYIENWSLGFDIWLILKTVSTVLARRGAY